MKQSGYEKLKTISPEKKNKFPFKIINKGEHVIFLGKEGFSLKLSRIVFELLSIIFVFVTFHISFLLAEEYNITPFQLNNVFYFALCAVKMSIKTEEVIVDNVEYNSTEELEEELQ